MRDMRLVFIQFLMGSACMLGGVGLTEGSPSLRLIALIVGFVVALKAGIEFRLEAAERDDTNRRRAT